MSAGEGSCLAVEASPGAVCVGSHDRCGSSQQGLLGRGHRGHRTSWRCFPGVHRHGAAAGTHWGSRCHHCHTQYPLGPHGRSLGTGMWQSAHQPSVHRCCQSCRSRWRRGPWTHRAHGGAGGCAVAGHIVRAAIHTHYCRWKHPNHTQVPPQLGRCSSCTHRRPGLDLLCWARIWHQSHRAFPCTHQEASEGLM